MLIQIGLEMKKLLLVRPPRYLWPFINESDNFLLPLGMPCLAGAVRQWVPEIEVKVVDCLPLKMGWRSLEKTIEEEKPDFIGAGEESLYHHEAVRLFHVAKNLNPDVVTIAGGHFFSWMVQKSLNEFPIDYIVRFEGEVTFTELLKTLINGSDPANVEGIAFKQGGKIVVTKERAMIKNLDDLPMPAFDLMPMGKYAPFGYLWPVSVTLEHSRGCVDHCSFCSLWTFWGKHKNTGIEDGHFDMSPCYRTKSVDRMLEEIDICYNKYGRRYIIWADPTFNVDPKWTEEFCDKLLSRGYTDLYWWAFLRADYTLRDEKLGVLEKMVRAGLRHPLIGIERSSDEGLREVDKSVYTTSLIKEVFGIFKRKYPEVFRQGTFVTCLPSDSKEDMLSLVDYAVEIDIDYPAFHPAAPVPGTKLYQDAVKYDMLATKDFKKYDWATPIMKSQKGLSTEDLADLNFELNKRYVLHRPHWLIRGLFSRYKHKRNLYWWFLINTVKMILLSIRDIILGKNETAGVTGFQRLKKPEWYND